MTYLRGPCRRLISTRLLLVLQLALASAGCVGDGLVLGSNRTQVNPHGAWREVVRVKGRTVECWVARSPGAAKREPAAFVVLFLGRGDRSDGWASAVAQQWGDRPVEVWGMNYPGSGGSAGPATLASVAPAALGTYDAVAKLARGRPVFVQAASFGTTAGLAVAARRKIAGAILWNPPPLKQLILGHYGWWNLWLLAFPAWLQVPPELDSIANGRRAHAPAVFVRCGADEVIPPRFQKWVVDAYAGPKRLIDMPGAGHSAALTAEAAGEMAQGMDWLWDVARAEKR